MKVRLFFYLQVKNCFAMTKLFLINHRPHRQQGRGGKEEKEEFKDGAAVRGFDALQTAEEGVEGVAGQVPKGDHADHKLDLAGLVRSVVFHQHRHDLGIGVAVGLGIVLGVDQGGDFVLRGVRLELEVEHVLDFLRADPAGGGLPGMEPGAVDAAVDRGDDGHDLLDEGAVERAQGPADLRRVGKHEAEVPEEERQGIDPAGEGFGHRDDCTRWGNHLDIASCVPLCFRKRIHLIRHPAGATFPSRGRLDKVYSIPNGCLAGL